MFTHKFFELKFASSELLDHSVLCDWTFILCEPLIGLAHSTLLELVCLENRLETLKIDFESP